MKKVLKKIPLFYSVNSHIKDIALSIETAWIERSYRPRLGVYQEEFSNRDIRLMLHKRMRERGVRLISAENRPLHIYFVGTYYDHEAFGFLQALQRLGRVSIYSDRNGVYGINSSRRGDGSPATSSDNSFFLEHVRSLHADNPIDLVIGTFLASSVSVDTLVSIREMGIPVVNYAMDDRLPLNWRTHRGVRMGAIGLIAGVDLTLQSTKEFVPRYLSEGCPCVYWPFGSDPEIYSPEKSKKYDVVFVGNNYGKRGALVKALQAAGIRIECYGNDFPNGHLAGDRVAGIFSQAKIILGTGLVGHSSRILTLKLRDFDAPMSGALYITNNNPALSALYDIGKEIVTYASVRDCVDKIRLYLDDEQARESIAKAGRERAIKDHTWDQRFSLMVQLLSV